MGGPMEACQLEQGCYNCNKLYVFSENNVFAFEMSPQRFEKRKEKVAAFIDCLPFEDTRQYMLVNILTTLIYMDL